MAGYAAALHWLACEARSLRWENASLKRCIASRDALQGQQLHRPRQPQSAPQSTPQPAPQPAPQPSELLQSKSQPRQFSPSSLPSAKSVGGLSGRRPPTPQQFMQQAMLQPRPQLPQLPRSQRHSDFEAVPAVRAAPAAPAAQVARGAAVAGGNLWRPQSREREAVRVSRSPVQRPWTAGQPRPCNGGIVTRSPSVDRPRSPVSQPPRSAGQPVPRPCNVQGVECRGVARGLVESKLCPERARSSASERGGSREGRNSGIVARSPSVDRPRNPVSQMPAVAARIQARHPKDLPTGPALARGQARCETPPRPRPIRSPSPGSGVKARPAARGSLFGQIPLPTAGAACSPCINVSRHASPLAARRVPLPNHKVPEVAIPRALRSNLEHLSLKPEVEQAIRASILESEHLDQETEEAIAAYQAGGVALSPSRIRSLP